MHDTFVYKYCNVLVTLWYVNGIGRFSHMCVNIFIDKVLCLQNTVMRRPRYFTIVKSLTCTQMHVNFDWHLPEASKQLLLSCDEYTVLDKLCYIIIIEWKDGICAVNRISWVSTYRVPSWL